MSETPKRITTLLEQATPADADCLIIDGTDGTRKTTVADLKSYLASAFAGAPTAFSPATAANSGLVKVNTSDSPGVAPTVYKKSEIDSIRTRTEIHVKDFGGACDGVTNDYQALRDAVAALQDGQTLNLGKVLIRVPTYSGVAATLDNLANITVRGTIVNDEFATNLTGTIPDARAGGTTQAVWFQISSLTGSGTTATATTSVPHGLSIGTVVVVRNDTLAFCGAVTVASTTSTSFTYQTLGETITSNGTGVMAWAYSDYDRTFLKFTRCSNVTLDITYIGQNRPRYATHRLGYQVALFRQSAGVDSTIKRVDLDLTGATNGLAAGYYQSAEIGHVSGGKIKIRASNTGYPISGWGRAFSKSEITVDASEVHRAAYLGGIYGATIRVTVKDFDNSGLLLTSHAASGGTHYGPQDINAESIDTGTTTDCSFNRNQGRFLIGINGETGSGTPAYKNIRLSTSLTTTDTIGKNIVAARIYHQGTNCVFEDITLSGSIDRSAVTDISTFFASNEIFFRLLSGSELRNFVLRDFRVKNSTATAGQSLFQRDIVIPNLTGKFITENSATDSYTGGISITAAAGGIIDDVDSGQVYAPDGTQGAPSIAFTSDPDTGFYHSGANSIRCTIGGALAFSFFSTGIFPAPGIAFDLGSDTNPFQFLYASGVIENPLTLTYGATTNLDLTSLRSVSTLPLAGNVTFTTSNRRAGRRMWIRLVADGSTRNLTFPAGWKFIGSGGMPATIAANKTAILQLWTWGSNDTDVVAKYDVEA